MTVSMLEPIAHLPWGSVARQSSGLTAIHRDGDGRTGSADPDAKAQPPGTTPLIGDRRWSLGMLRKRIHHGSHIRIDSDPARAWNRFLRPPRRLPTLLDEGCCEPFFVAVGCPACFADQEVVHLGAG